MDAMELAGKTAIVTGASSGIGAATVRKLREAGVRVVGGARRSSGSRPTSRFELDVRDEASADGVRRRRGRRARRSRHPLQQRRARARPGSVHRVDPRRRGARPAHERRRRPPDDAARAAALPRRRPHPLHGLDRRAGRPYPGGASYIASKYAVRGFSYAIREDLLGRPIRVTTVDAGLVETEFSLVRFKGDQRRRMRSTTVLDPVTPDEVADCVMFALTRPPHVNLDEIVIKAIAQSSGSHVVRRTT